MLKRRPWTAVDDECMRRFYPDWSGADMARALNRSERSIYARAAGLGLHKSAEFLASDLSGRIARGHQNEAMKATRFKPGQATWNKGLKGVVGVQEACRATQFKKGEMAGAAKRNYKPVGTLRVNADGILERKVTDDHPVPARRWAPVTRLVWEAANGPIPEGHVVRFRQGMATTELELITLDRLECISRIENMRRNSVHTVYPPELAKLVQLRGALNRQINARTRATEQA